MIRALLLSLALALPGAPVAADTVEAVRTLRSGTLLAYGDVTLVPGPAAPGMADSIEAVVGQELRSSIYRGRAVRLSDLGPPTLVRRNDIVTLYFRQGALSIRGEGRALGDGGEGERLRVMNLDSRLIVTGRVRGPSLVEVSR